MVLQTIQSHHVIGVHFFYTDIRTKVWDFRDMLSDKTFVFLYTINPYLSIAIQLENQIK